MPMNILTPSQYARLQSDEKLSDTEGTLRRNDRIWTIITTIGVTVTLFLTAILVGGYALSTSSNRDPQTQDQVIDEGRE